MTWLGKTLVTMVHCMSLHLVPIHRSTSLVPWSVGVADQQTGLIDGHLMVIVASFSWQFICGWYVQEAIYLVYVPIISEGHDIMIPRFSQTHGFCSIVHLCQPFVLYKQHINVNGNSWKTQIQNCLEVNKICGTEAIYEILLYFNKNKL